MEQSDQPTEFTVVFHIKSDFDVKRKPGLIEISSNELQDHNLIIKQVNGKSILVVPCSALKEWFQGPTCFPRNSYESFPTDTDPLRCCTLIAKRLNLTFHIEFKSVLFCRQFSEILMNILRATKGVNLDQKEHQLLQENDFLYINCQNLTQRIERLEETIDSVTSNLQQVQSSEDGNPKQKKSSVSFLGKIRDLIGKRDRTHHVSDDVRRYNQLVDDMND